MNLFNAPIDYKIRITVGPSEFNDPGDPLKLSNKMQEIFDFIKKVAVKNFTEEKFRKFYQQGFAGADFIYMRDKEKRNEKIGFLFSSYHKQQNGPLMYIGKAFPGIKKSYRGITKYRYNSAHLYLNIFKFYLKNVISEKTTEITADAVQLFLTDTTVFSFTYLLSRLQSLIKLENNQPSMKVFLNVENPSTYSDFFRYKLITNLSSIITPAQKAFLEPLQEKEMRLLRDASILLNLFANAPFIEQVEKTGFSVDIDEDEREEHLKRFNIDPANLKKKKPHLVYRKHFIWTNPKYPEYAYKAEIDVSFRNFAGFLKNFVKSQLFDR